jgi:DNA-binding response OmpR family regulator
VSKRILSVSYDVSLLATRRMLLELAGYTVISALGFTDALECCAGSGFDLFILGHSIPTKDKQELIRAFRKNCPAPIVSLERVDELRVESDFHASPDNPEKLLKTIGRILTLIEPGSSQGTNLQASRTKPISQQNIGGSCLD